MNKKMKIILAFTLIALILTSCGEKTIIPNNANINAEKAGGLELPIDTNHTKITWVAVSSADNLNDKYLFNKLREITGLNIEIVSYPAATSTEKVKVLLASKDLPDIIGDRIGTIGEINDLAVQGAFAPVNDYLKVMPNFKKLFSDHENYNWVFNSYAASDNKLYALPHLETQRDVNHGMLYRKDIFDKHNLSMWNSPEEFKTVLQKLKEIYPESDPFSSKNQEDLFASLSTSWGIASFKPYYDEAAKVWKYSDTDDKSKEMLDYLKDLYDSKLIDQEFLTLTQAAWTAKMTQENKVFTTFDWIGRMDMFKDQTKDTLPNYDLRYGNPIGPKGTIITLSKIVPLFAVVAKNKNTELSMKLMDFMYSPMGMELSTIGIEGETYQSNQDGTISYLGFDENKKIEITDLEEKYGMFVQGTYKRIDKRSCYFNYSIREQEAQDKGNNENRFEPEDPVLSFTKEELSILNEKQGNLTTAAKETFVKYILTDKTGEAAWKAWMERANMLGAEEVIAVYNQAQKRYDEKRSSK